jgi:NADH dehydrogenase FAD-containing subunit
MQKHLVLVGGGHAHLTTMLNLNHFVEQRHRVTLISPSSHHYYSGMGPGLLSEIYSASAVRFNVKKMTEDRGATFVSGTVVRVDPEQRKLYLKSGETVEYDVVSFNVGSHVPLSAMADSIENLFTVKPIDNLIKAQKVALKLLQDGEPRMLVIGGGPAGFELSGNLWRLVQNHNARARITVLAGRELLSAFPPKVRQLALNSLSSRQIEVIQGANVDRFENGCAYLEDDREFPADLIFLAWGVRPSELFMNSDLPTGEDGGLLVNSYLQSVRYPEIFGGGDCISLQNSPLDKVGVYPVRQNPILYHNLLAAMTGAEMKLFEPGDRYLLIFNMGDGKGILFKNNWIWAGRLSFILKDYIDRKFMKKFQVSGELDG